MLCWVEDQLGPGARVTSWRRLTGGLGSTVHRLTVEKDGARRAVVLRCYEEPASSSLIEHEATALGTAGGLPFETPELLGHDAAGAATDGRPALLMSRVAGRLRLDPRDRDAWSGRLADAAAAIHDLEPRDAPPFEPWFDPDRREVPRSAGDPSLWELAYRSFASPPRRRAGCSSTATSSTSTSCGPGAG